MAEDGGAVVGLMDRALDLKPEVTQGCGFESWLRQEVHDCSPGAAQSAAHLWYCAISALGWVKCREHISLLIILCIIVYVTNKAHPSLVCIVFVRDSKRNVNALVLCRLTSESDINLSQGESSQDRPSEKYIKNQIHIK